MVYLLTLIVLCLFIYLFDLNKGSQKTAKLCFNLFTVWLILLSGFAYQVGADIPGYMQEYDTFGIKKIESFSDLFGFKDNRQPLWVLLEYICHSISSNFFVFKLVIAIIGNWAFCRFIYKHSDYPFVTLLFYCLIVYLNLNFNALRQFMAIAFFLMGYDAMAEKKWVKYYAFCLCALLFHSTAIICFVLPLFHIIPINKKSVIIISSALLASVFFILQFDMIDYVYDIVLNNADLMTEEYADLAESYLEGADSAESTIIGMIFIALQVFVVVFILYVNLKRHGEDQPLMLKMLFVYMFFIILNRAIPIVFTRFMQYFDIFYCCLLPSAVIPFCRRITKLNLVPIFAIAILAFLPINTLLSENKQSGRPLIVQYDPYYSIFNPKIDPQRSMLFGSYRGNSR